MSKHIKPLIFVLLLACNPKNKEEKGRIELVKQYDYLIDIEIWNGFAGKKDKFTLNNKRIGRYDSSDVKFKQPKPLTLYYVSYLQEADTSNPNIRIFVPKDTIEVPFSKSQSDKLFELTKRFFKSIDFNNYDTSVNGLITTPVIFDDSQARIGLSYGGKRMDVTISSINNPSMATTELSVLLKYVQNSVPGKKVQKD